MEEMLIYIRPHLSLFDFQPSAFRDSSKRLLTVLTHLVNSIVAELHIKLAGAINRQTCKNPACSF